MLRRNFLQSLVALCAAPIVSIQKSATLPNINYKYINSVTNRDYVSLVGPTDGCGYCYGAYIPLGIKVGQKTIEETINAFIKQNKSICDIYVYVIKNKAGLSNVYVTNDPNLVELRGFRKNVQKGIL